MRRALYGDGEPISTVREILPKVKAPTLVMHVRDEPSVPINLGRELAAGIPGTQFVELPGRNHVSPRAGPRHPVLFAELKDFLKNAI